MDRSESLQRALKPDDSAAWICSAVPSRKRLFAIVSKSVVAVELALRLRLTVSNASQVSSRSLCELPRLLCPPRVFEGLSVEITKPRILWKTFSWRSDFCERKTH